MPTYKTLRGGVVVEATPEYMVVEKHIRGRRGRLVALPDPRINCTIYTVSDSRDDVCHWENPRFEYYKSNWNDPVKRLMDPKSVVGKKIIEASKRVLLLEDDVKVVPTGEGRILPPEYYSSYTLVMPDELVAGTILVLTEREWRDLYASQD